nr:MAG TPA: hypothetical protein [Caudoviricetes sp.]
MLGEKMVKNKPSRQLLRNYLLITKMRLRSI